MHHHKTCIYYINRLKYLPEYWSHLIYLAIPKNKGEATIKKKSPSYPLCCQDLDFTEAFFAMFVCMSSKLYYVLSELPTTLARILGMPVKENPTLTDANSKVIQHTQYQAVQDSRSAPGTTALGFGSVSLAVLFISSSSMCWLQSQAGCGMADAFQALHPYITSVERERPLLSVKFFQEYSGCCNVLHLYPPYYHLAYSLRTYRT